VSVPSNSCTYHLLERVPAFQSLRECLLHGLSVTCQPKRASLERYPPSFSVSYTHSLTIMGDAGSLVLVNGTPYSWQLTNIHSYQLVQWSFPRAIPPFSSTAVTVQRDDAPLRDRNQDGGEATYTIIGAPGTKPLMFQVQARADNGLPFRLQVLLQSVAAQNKPVGSLITLGWVVRGQTNFVFAGSYNPTATGTGFVCNDMPSAWMQASLPLLGSRMLRQICMPGTHDSGELRSRVACVS